MLLLSRKSMLIGGMRLHKVFALLSLLIFTMPLFAASQLKGEDLFTGKEIEVKSGEKGLVVVFLSAKCPCSISHMPELLELAKTNTKFTFVAVHSNVDETTAEAREYFTQAKLPFTIIKDHDAKIADQYKALKTPHAFVTDSNGKTVFQGGLSDSTDCSESGKRFLREALSDLMAGRKVRVANARPLGCAISRGKDAG